MERDNLTEYLSTKDFLVTGETFHLLYDKEMDMLCTSPQPRPENLSRYYESDAYISHTDSGRGLLAMLYQTVKKYSLKKKTGLIKKINKKPERFQEKKVIVRGKVISALDLLDINCFTLKQNSNNLLVVTDNLLPLKRDIFAITCKLKHT